MIILYIALTVAALAYGKTLVECIAYEVNQHKAVKEHENGKRG